MSQVGRNAYLGHAVFILENKMTKNTYLIIVIIEIIAFVIIAGIGLIVNLLPAWLFTVCVVIAASLLYKVGRAIKER